MNLSLDTSFGFGDIPNNQSIFMNDNDITVDDYLHLYSTVTTFAKLRGKSGFNPFSKAQ
jgi:hypothetical protein